MPVLITAGLSPEAYRLQRILNVRDAVFSDETELPLFSSGRSLVLPAYTSSSFVHEMLKACLDHGISHVYPLKLGELIELSKARGLFSEYGIVLMIPSDYWLNGRDHQSSLKRENLTVLENGKVLAGSPPPDYAVINETGAFTWATPEQNLEYSLYLV